jgi:tetratricopeptide (TPR) repeat protein
VAALIAQAGALHHVPEQALPLLEQACAAAPRHPAPLIALYRFYFYGHQLAQARAVAEDALAIARTALGSQFGDVPPAEADARYNAAVRFYLFTLKGMAYLSMRLGDMADAHQLLKELRRLDPQDHVGGGLLSHVLCRHENAERGNAPVDYPVRGWSAAGP